MTDKPAIDESKVVLFGKELTEIDKVYQIILDGLMTAHNKEINAAGPNKEEMDYIRLVALMVLGAFYKDTSVYRGILATLAEIYSNATDNTRLSAFSLEPIEISSHCFFNSASLPTQFDSFLSYSLLVKERKQWLDFPTFRILEFNFSRSHALFDSNVIEDALKNIHNVYKTALPKIQKVLNDSF